MKNPHFSLRISVSSKAGGTEIKYLEELESVTNRGSHWIATFDDGLVTVISELDFEFISRYVPWVVKQPVEEDEVEAEIYEFGELLCFV